MSEPSRPEFGRMQRIFWPVHRSELQKLLPMLLIVFLITFNYNILRSMKDTFLVTAKSSGAQVIPFVKVWAMFPMAVILTGLFTYLSSRWSRDRVFYIMNGLFLAFFFLFATILYPYREAFHPHAFADRLTTTLPQGGQGFVAMIRYWPFTLFYVMSELWNAVIVSTCFWGFANQVVTVSEAKRFYGLFGVGLNFSGIVAAPISMALIKYGHLIPISIWEPGERWLYLKLYLILAAGGCALLLFRWLNRHVLTEKQLELPVREASRAKASLSLFEAFGHILKSRYLLCIAVIVVVYNAVINLVEVVWKDQVSVLYSTPKDFNYYMDEVMLIIGIIATLTSLLISGNSLRKRGWTFTAMLTPIILLVTSVAFFGAIFGRNGWFGMAFLGFIPLTWTVFLGSFQNVMSRAAKYTVFDATKELAFVPLGYEGKVKGKAAIDGVCSRLGKSGGSMIHQGLLFGFGSIAASTPCVAACLLVIIVVWMGAVYLLGREFTGLTAENADEGLVLAPRTQVLVAEESLVAKQQTV